MYKVRFHLAKGPNFMHWQVKSCEGEVQYFDPDKFSLQMYECVLKSAKATATKINQGANKSVCAWIECEDFVAVFKKDMDLFDIIRYNPRKAPHWCDEHGDDIDDTFVFTVYSQGIALGRDLLEY